MVREAIGGKVCNCVIQNLKHGWAKLRYNFGISSEKIDGKHLVTSSKIIFRRQDEIDLGRKAAIEPLCTWISPGRLVPRTIVVEHRTCGIVDVFRPFVFRAVGGK